MAFVSSCPENEEEYMKASLKRGCGYDTNNRSQYLCLPNKEKTSLVELCYNEQMGIREKGHCLEATIGKLIERNCQNFTFGCPREDFYDNEIYKYPACQNINRKQQCYVMDPFCPPQVSDNKTERDDAIFFASGFLGGFLVLSVVVFLSILLWRSKKCKDRTHRSGVKYTPPKASDKDETHSLDRTHRSEVKYTPPKASDKDETHSLGNQKRDNQNQRKKCKINSSSRCAIECCLGRDDQHDCATGIQVST